MEEKADHIQVTGSYTQRLSHIVAFLQYKQKCDGHDDIRLNRITRYTPDLSRSQVDATIAQAFQLYSDVIPLDFKQINSGTADIMILFKGGCESGLNKSFLNTAWIKQFPLPSSFVLVTVPS